MLYYFLLVMNGSLRRVQYSLAFPLEEFNIVLYFLSLVVSVCYKSFGIVVTPEEALLSSKLLETRTMSLC